MPIGGVMFSGSYEAHRKRRVRATPAFEHICYSRFSIFVALEAQERRR
jgi:hypothetical protein